MVEIFVFQFCQSFDKLIKLSFGWSIREEDWRGGGSDWSICSLVILILYRGKEAGFFYD